jgi:hypothetical protein
MAVSRPASPKHDASAPVLLDAEKAQIHQLEDGETELHPQDRVKSEAEKKLIRKLDWFILPLLWLMYWFNYLDRNAITVARLDGLEKELNLTSTQYSTCVSILFVGYILGQIPSSKRASIASPSLPR